MGIFFLKMNIGNTRNPYIDQVSWDVLFKTLTPCNVFNVAFGQVSFEEVFITGFRY